MSGNVATTNKNVAGITRTTTTDPLFGQVTNTTTIEGVLDITSEGDIKLKNGSFAVDYNGNMTAANGAFKASQRFQTMLLRQRHCTDHQLHCQLLRLHGMHYHQQ